MPRSRSADPAGEHAAVAETAPVPRRKKLEDTPDGCRALAAADLRRADELTGDHARWRYQHSAQSWLARAGLLDRLEANYQARLARLAIAKTLPAAE